RLREPRARVLGLLSPPLVGCPLMTWRVDVQLVEVVELLDRRQPELGVPGEIPVQPRGARLLGPDADKVGKAHARTDLRGSCSSHYVSRLQRPSSVHDAVGSALGSGSGYGRAPRQARLPPLSRHGISWIAPRGRRTEWSN